MREITEAQVKALWATMKKEFGVRLRPKSGSTAMKAVAKALDWLRKLNPGMMTGKSFMASTWTTVGRAVYYPTAGMGSLRNQIDKAVHEGTHVLQRVGYKYLLSPARRAKIETDAFIASMEIHHWMTGDVPSPAVMAARLKPYGCTEAQIKYAESKYRAAARMIKKGNYRSETVKTAIKVLG